MSPFRDLFKEPIKCTGCGESAYWSIDPVKKKLVCLSPLSGEENDFCLNEAEPGDVFTPEKMLLFNRLLQVFRLFPAR